MDTKISFVIPTYNRVEWLAECVESLRNQTLKEIEIIVIDDCSKDTTPKLMDWFINQDKRIIYIRNKKNLKAGLSRNIGNNLAKSEIICVCDDDDYYPDYRAEFTYNFFQENHDIDIMNGSYYRVDYSNRIMQEFKSFPFNIENFKDGKEIYFCHPSCAYRKKDILAFPYKNENEKETDDYLLIKDWVTNNKKIGNVDKILCFHRVLPESIMTKMRSGDLD